MPSDNAGNSLTTAREIQILNGNQLRSFSDRVDALDLNDYYKFRIQGRSSFGLKLTNSTGDANLELLNTNGDRLQSSLNNNSTSELINTTLEAGTYYIRVYQGSGLGTDYNLDISSQTNLKSDILWRNQVSGQDVVWQMNGATIASGQLITPIPDLNWQMVAAGDFNQDGQSDIVWRNSLSGQNVIWLMNGTSIASGLLIAPVADLNWKIVTAGDFNNDGKADLVWRNSASGQNVIWLMNGTSIASGLLITPVPDLNWEITTAGDFNNDGQSDLVWRNKLSGSNVVWLMNGTSIASGLEIAPVRDLNWKMVGSSDFDNDGQSDLIWRNSVSGANVVWYMNGTLIRSGIEIAAVPDLNWKITSVAQRFDTPAPIDLVGNTLSSAFNIGTLLGNSSFTEWIGGGDTADHYKFSVNDRSEINFTLSTPNAMYDILDSAGNPILVQRSTINPRINALLNAGTYYVRINNSNQLTNYTLSIAATLQPLNTITLSVTDTIATERQTNQVQDPGRFTINRSGSLTAALTVNYGVSGSATNGLDYSSLSGSVTFAIGQSSVILPINIVDDAIAERAETLIVTLTSGSGYTLGTTTSGTVSIADNDIASIVVTNTNETLRPGTAYNITWTDNISENIAIYLFKGNSLYSTLTTSTASDGSYIWTLPTDIGYGIDYRIAVATADASTSDFSDNYFSIKPDLKQYSFQYLFDPQNPTTTDLYSGSVIAVNGKYTLTPQQSGGRYLVSDLYNFTSRSTEAGTDGRYVITAISDYNDDLINNVGRVFVNQYVDRDNGADRIFTPINNQSGQASGSNYLGSELDYIDASRSVEGRFGQDYYEADFIAPFVVISDKVFSGNEGDRGSFKIRLYEAPTSDVTIKFTSGNFITVDNDNVIQNGTQDSITFNSSNWNIAKTIGFLAENDGSSSNRTSGNSIVYTVSGPKAGTGSYDIGTVTNTYSPDNTKFNIDLDFRNDYSGYWTAARRAIAQQAADDWARLIANEYSGITVDNQSIDQIGVNASNEFMFSANRFVDDMVIFVGAYAGGDNYSGWGGPLTTSNIRLGRITVNTTDSSINEESDLNQTYYYDDAIGYRTGAQYLYSLVSHELGHTLGLLGFNSASLPYFTGNGSFGYLFSGPYSTSYNGGVVKMMNFGHPERAITSVMSYDTGWGLSAPSEMDKRFLADSGYRVYGVNAGSPSSQPQYSPSSGSIGSPISLASTNSIPITEQVVQIKSLPQCGCTLCRDSVKDMAMLGSGSLIDQVIGQV